MQKHRVNSQKLQTRQQLQYSYVSNNCAAKSSFLLDEFFYSSTTVEDRRKQKKFKLLLQYFSQRNAIATAILNI